jgi:hypothetical protein
MSSSQDMPDRQDTPDRQHTTLPVVLSLRPTPDEQQEDDNFGSLVSRLHQEASGFRHMSEEKLRQAPPDALLVLNEATKPEPEKGSKEYLENRGMEMFRYLS